MRRIEWPECMHYRIVMFCVVLIIHNEMIAWHKDYNVTGQTIVYIRVICGMVAVS